MQRFAFIVLALFLTACGSETLGTAATVGAAKNEEIKNAKKAQEQIQQRLDAANQAAQQQRDEAERLSGQ